MACPELLGELTALLLLGAAAEDDYSAIWDYYAYINDRADWFYKDFGKPNATGGRAWHLTAPPLGVLSPMLFLFWIHLALS